MGLELQRLFVHVWHLDFQRFSRLFEASTSRPLQAFEIFFLIKLLMSANTIIAFAADQVISAGPHLPHLHLSTNNHWPLEWSDSCLVIGSRGGQQS
jgi:hypothetical protein